MITVKIQQNSIPALEAYIFDITDRIPISEIKNLEEKIEDERFSFRANDIDIKNINNSDDYFRVAENNSQLNDVQQTISYGGRNYFYYPYYGYALRGAIIYIYWNDEEIFRGYSRPSDMKFNPVNPKTVSIRFFNWIKRLEEFELDNFDGKADIDLLLDQVEESLFTFDNQQPFFTSVYKDLDALEFDGTVEMGALDRITDAILEDTYRTRSDRDDVTDNINDIVSTQYQDIWVDPRTNRAYGLRFSSNRINIELYRIRGQYEYLIKSWKAVSLPGVGTSRNYSARSESKLYFVRSVIDDYDSNVGIFADLRTARNRSDEGTDDGASDIYAEYFTVDTRLNRMYRKRAYVGVEYADDITEMYNNVLVLNNTWIEKDYPIICDGYSYYEIQISETSIVIDHKNRYGTQINASVALSGSFEFDNFYAPTRNRVVYYRTLETTSKWQIINFDTFTPTYSEGDFLPTALTSNADSNTIISVYPIGYTDDSLNGKYAYFLVHQIYSLDFIIEVPGFDDIEFEYEFGLKSWQINDMIWVALSSIYYEDTVNIMDILLDICQVTNGVISTSDGILNIYSKLKYVNTYTISQDYIKRDNYSYNIEQTDDEFAKLKFATKCLTDPPDTEFSNKIYTNLLKRYYEKEYSQTFKIWDIEIPLSIGLNINLSDRILIQETGNYGVVIEKESNFESENRMVKLTVQFVQPALKPTEIR